MRGNKKKVFLSFRLVFGFVWLFWFSPSECACLLLRLCLNEYDVVLSGCLLMNEQTQLSTQVSTSRLCCLLLSALRKKKRISNNFRCIWRHVPLIQNLEVCQSLFPDDFYFSRLACHPPKIAFVGSGTFCQHDGLKIHHIFITFAIWNTLLTDL